MRRLFTIGLCCALAATALMGCSNQNIPEATGSDDSSATVVEEESKINTKTDTEITKSFVKALIEKDYETAMLCLNIDAERSFISADDMEYAIPRSGFASLMDDSLQGTTAEYASDYTTGADKTTVAVTFVKDDVQVEKISVDTVLTENNEWKVESPDFYYKDFSFRAPSGKVTITANDKEITNEYITGNSTGKHGKCCDYTLPYVGKKGLEIKVTCDNYTYETVLTTSSNNKADDSQVLYNVDTDEYDAICTYIKDTWNSMYNDWYEGKKANDLVTSYLSNNADPDIANRIADGFKAITKPSAFSSKGNDQVKVTELNPNKNDAYYITDKVIVVNFNYKLNWHYILADWMQDMKRTSSIMLSKENGEYKIYDLIDDKLFTYCNSFTQDW